MTPHQNASGICVRHCLPATYDALGTARESFKQDLARIGIIGEALHNWIVVFSEALTNAIEHGAHNDPNITITVRWSIVDNMVELMVSDPGLGFSLHDTTTLLRTRGYGLTLMRYFCDGMEHLINPSGGHLLRLYKTHDNIKTQGYTQVHTGVDVRLPEMVANFYSQLKEACDLRERVTPLVEGLATLLHPALVEIHLGESFAKYARDIPQSSVEIPCKHCSSCTPYLQGKSFGFIRDNTSINCYPIKLGLQLYGTIMVNAPQTQGNIDGYTTKTIEIIAHCLAIAIDENQRQTARSNNLEALMALQVAANLQNRQRQLKHLSSRAPGKVWAFENRAEMVAGDLIECASAPDGGSYMLIADVMGKGVAAAFLGGIFRGGWHLLSQSENHPMLMMRKLNKFLYDELNGQTMFVTAALAHLSADGKMMTLINAGHTSIYLQLNNGHLQPVDSSGPPMGLFEDAEYHMEIIKTKDVARLYMPTDGLFCWGDKPSDFKESKLLDFLIQNTKNPAEDLWKAIQEASDHASEQHKDDQSMLVWERSA